VSAVTLDQRPYGVQCDHCPHCRQRSETVVERWRRRTWISVRWMTVGGLSLVFAAWLVLQFVVAWAAANPIATRSSARPPSLVAEHWEEVEWRPGAPTGFYAAPSDLRGSVLVVHGWADSIENHTGVADFLRRQGYGVLVVPLSSSLPGHGFSGGAEEAAEVHAASLWLAEQTGAPVAALTFSTGGVVTLQAIQQGAPIDAVAADSPFLSTTEVFAGQASGLTRLPRQIFGGVELAFRVLTGETLISVHPDPELWRVPTLVIHGSADEVVPYDEGVAVAQRTAGHLVTVAGSGHTRARSTGIRRYDERLDRFLRSALDLPPLIDDPPAPVLHRLP
jgi:alpha-beta hydrolase superfamily lysophospholipase